jgi:hypothetical protein
MKAKKICLCGCSLLVCAIAALSIRADKPVPPPDPKAIAGTWFGFDEGKVRFCRIELYPDGQGLYAYVFVDTPARLYKIKKWSLDDFNISVDLEPVEKDTERIYMKGTALLDELKMEIGGIGNKTWKRQVRLFKEQEFLSKNGRAKERIEKYKADQKAKSGK